MTDKVQKIREEIARLKSNLIHGSCASQIAMLTMWKEEAYNEVLAILDTMQEEPVSEDLEKEMDSYFMKMQVQEHERIFEGTFRDIASHFAWWQKQQMIKDVVECDIEGTIIGTDGNFGLARIKGDYNYGDKVKLIIVKED